MAYAVLTHRVMLNHRDTQTSRTPSEDASRVAEFLSVSTFLKPQFRIAVAPTGGELQVQVELRSVDVRARLSSRH